MLDRHHCRHAVAHVRPGEVHVLLLQNAQISGVIVDHIGEHGLEAGQVGASLGIVDIVAEPQNILMKLIDILECHFHGDALALAAEGDHFMDRFLRLVHILYESGDAVWLMVGHFLLRFLALVLENDGQLRVQISGLVKTAFHVVLLKPRFIKNGVIRQEVDNGLSSSRSLLFCPPPEAVRPSGKLWDCPSHICPHR